MKKIIPLAIAVILITLVFSSCSLTIKNLGDTDSQTKDTSSDTSGDIIPGENELPAIPIIPSNGGSEIPIVGIE